METRQKSRRAMSKGDRVQPTNVGKKSFYDRWGWIILIGSLACIPFAFFGAGKAIQSNVNKVEDWLPKSFAETGELAWFRKNFPSDQFILVSWEGCKLGEDPSLGAEFDDPRIARLASLVAPEVVDDNNIDAVEAKKFFKKVSTGRQLLDQMTTGSHALSYPEAIERLKGSVLGPDGRQTCVIVSLDPETTGKLKPILGHGQTRIFRPNIPPGVLRRLIAQVGIPDQDLHLGGPPVDNISIDEEGEKTLVRLAGFSGLLGLILAWWSLRSVVLTWIVFFCAVTSAAASLAIIWATGETVDAIVLSMPSLVYVLAISGAVHFINYYKDAVQEGGLRGSTERAVIHALKPAILCSTTTAIGLLSLCASELTPIRKFGLYAASGVMVLNVVLYLLLPSTLHIIGYAKRWVTSPGRKEPSPKVVVAHHVDTKAEKLWESFARFIVRHHFGVATGCVLVVALIGFGLTKTRTSIDLLELFDSQSRILKDYRWLEKKLGMLVPLEIVIQFDPSGMAKTADANSQETSKEDVRGEESNESTATFDPTKLTFLERMETVVQIQEAINNRFGEKGSQIVGRSMSAATFASSLPSSKGISTKKYLERTLYNNALEGKRDEFVKSGFLRVDASGAELWRISLRVAAFEGVDYGTFVHDLRDAVSPIVDAHSDRVRILNQLASWSGENKFTGKEVMIWDPIPKGMEDGESNGTSKLRSDELSALLTKARVKVTRGTLDPVAIPLVQLQRLSDYDAVVLTGAFSDQDIGALSVTLGKVIDLHAPQPEGSKAWVSSTYTGVVPIVYKAQRALLQSLVESTLWSFLTITPLMMFVSRSFRAGLVAMIPNVLPVVVIFGAMGWLNISIDIGSMMTASIALGVAVDDTIHFLSWFRDDLKQIGDRRTAITTCYKRCATPTLQAACISGLGLSVFALSSFTPTQRFGWLMLTILIAGVVSELILLPAILAGPLGKVFEPSQSRHGYFSRFVLIMRYELRRRFDRRSTLSPVNSDAELQSAA
jgi:predicted RND superfamily exporter protein